MFKASILAIMLLQDLEGFRSHVYRNGGGRDTIGFGHLVRAGENWSGGVTKAEATELLHRDLKVAEQSVNSLVTNTINQNQFDALVIWTYNLGGANLKRSTMLKRVNSGKLDLVPFEMARWIHTKHRDTGKVEAIPGLVNRRNKEIELWKTPVKG